MLADLGPLLAKEVIGERFKERMKVAAPRNKFASAPGSEDTDNESRGNECGQDEFRGEGLVAGSKNESERGDENNRDASSDNEGNIGDSDAGEPDGEWDYDGSDTPWSDTDSNHQGVDAVPIWWYERST